MKCDLHIHTHYSPDSMMAPKTLINRCLKVGLNCIAVTDHNTIEGALEVQRLAPFMVIIGEEVASSDGEITGLFLKEKIPDGLSPVETVALIKDQGGLVSLPHPFDRFRRSVLSQRAREKILQYTDIVEIFNSRNNFNADNQSAYAFARKFGLLTSGVSDAHTPYELGRTYVKMPRFDGTPQSFMTSLSQGDITAHRTTPLVHAVSAFIKAKKRLLREYH